MLILQSRGKMVRENKLVLLLKTVAQNSTKKEKTSGTTLSDFKTKEM